MDASHKTALDKALAWISENFNPVGIIVTGSIIRGNPDKNSDFDIYVIHRENYRQRIQKYFDGIPCEIFVNNFKQVYAYFEQDFKDNRPVSAHMIATGEVIMGGDNPELKKLIESANEFLLKSPSLDDVRKTAMKYTISTMFEDAADIKDTDRLTSSNFLNKLMIDIIDFTFLANGIPLPRPKERIKYLVINYPDIGKLIADYYLAANFDDQYNIAKNLVLKTTGEYGFFEWDSGKDKRLG
jgi:predicted nucleotidyltransferase